MVRIVRKRRFLGGKDAVVFFFCNKQKARPPRACKRFLCVAI
jgi:hypothetical protein